MSSSTSAPDVAPLFEPLALGPIVIPNRIIMAALTRSRSVPTNIPNELNLEYYIQRAKGGAGLIVTEGVLVSPQGYVSPIPICVETGYADRVFSMSFILQIRMAQRPGIMECRAGERLEEDNRSGASQWVVHLCSTLA